MVLKTNLTTFVFTSRPETPGASLGQTGSAFQTGIAFVVADPVQKSDAPGFFDKVVKQKLSY